MRVNVYAEEMTDRVDIVEKSINGQVFTGLRIYLELPVTLKAHTSEESQVSGPFIHREKSGKRSDDKMLDCSDDDSSAVTFWGKADLRDILVKALGILDTHYAKRNIFLKEFKKEE